MTISIACANGITCTNPGCTHIHPINGDPKDLEIAALKASSEVMHVALENAVKRSTYEWSSGPHYTVRDFMNEGRIEIAKELLKKIEAQKTPTGEETKGGT